MTEPSIRSLAELPFHIAGRFPKAVLVGRCVGDELLEQSSRELFDRVRDLGLGLEAALAICCTRSTLCKRGTRLFRHVRATTRVSNVKQKLQSEKQ